MSTETQRKLYTDSLSPEKKQLAFRVRAKGGSSFQTCAFDFGSDGEIQNWVEAQKMPESERWCVSYCEQEVDENGQEWPIKILERRENLCFLDALYLCADFEKMGDDFVHPYYDTPEHIGRLYYKTFGENEGIVFDYRTGLPRLVVDQILVDADQAVLPPKANQIVRRSAGNLIPRNIRLSETFVGKDDLDKVSNLTSVTEMTAEIESKAEHKKGIKEAKSTAVQVFKECEGHLSQIKEKGYLSVGEHALNKKLNGALGIGLLAVGAAMAFNLGIFGAVIGGFLATGGVGGILEALSSSPRGGEILEQLLADLGEHIESLPDSPLRDEFCLAAGEVAMSQRVIAARYSARRHLRNKTEKNEELADKDIQAIRDEAKKRGLTVEEEEKFVKMVPYKLQKKSFEKDVHKKLCKSLEKLKKRAKKAAKQQYIAEHAPLAAKQKLPALEHKGA